MKTVDTRGQLCPAPIIAAKKALKEAKVGDSFIILTDNGTSFSNLSRFLRDNKANFTVKESDGEWEMSVTKLKEDTGLRPEDYCNPSIAHFEKGDFVIVLSSDRLGEGDEELGRLLAVNFIKAVKDLDHLPGKMIFYNSGVRLATNESPVIDHLKDLERMGVEVMLCSTCVGFYGLEKEIGVGTLGNMFTFASVMASAGKVIKP